MGDAKVVPDSPGRRQRSLIVFGLALCTVGVAMIAVLAAQRGLGRDFAAYDLSAYVRAAERIANDRPLYPQLDAATYRLGQQDLYLYPPPIALPRPDARAARAAPFVSAFVGYSYTVLLLPLIVLLVLDDVPVWARAAGVTAWLLINAQALDPAVVFPSALIGTALAVGGGLLLARRASSTSQ